MRNSLLVEEACADNERDSSMTPKQRVVVGPAFQPDAVRLESRTCSYGRRASHTPAKGYGQRTLDEVQVIMPERVTIKRVRIPFAESLRFPGEGKSAQG